MQVEEEQREDEIGSLRGEPQQSDPLERDDTQPHGARDPAAARRPSDERSYRIGAQQYHREADGGDARLRRRDHRPDDHEDGECNEQHVKTGAQAHEDGRERGMRHGPNPTRRGSAGIVRKEDPARHRSVLEWCADGR